MEVFRGSSHILIKSDMKMWPYTLKGIVSQKFHVLFLVSFESLEVSTPFLFYPFFTISSFSFRIFEYTMFSGEILLSHNTVKELLYRYVAGFVNSIVT
jgi:hypothetical protein